LLYYIGQLSLAALPVNLLVLIVVPAVMLFGFLSGVLGFIHFAPSMAFGVVAYLLLEYILLVVAFFAQIPFASVSVSYFPAGAVVISYILLLWLVRKRAATQTAKEKTVESH